jgi:hypothetical protein
MSEVLKRGCLEHTRFNFSQREGGDRKQGVGCAKQEERSGLP